MKTMIFGMVALKLVLLCLAGYYVYQFDINLFKAALCVAFVTMVKIEVPVK